jgi:hypothetical protein
VPARETPLGQKFGGVRLRVSNDLGHTDFPGCFRCHDGSHTGENGKAITQDCNACHEPLAMGEASPEILKTLGIAEQLSNIQKT